MVLANSVGLGIRNGSLRVSSLSVAPWRLCRSNTRLFSSVLKPTPSAHRLFVLQGPSSCRNFSIWPSSKSTPPLSTPETPAPDPAFTPVDEVAPSASVTEPASSTLLDPPVPAETSFQADSVVDATSSLSDTLLQHAPAALQYGDFAALGLAGWSPAGLVRWSFEIINVTTGLPWFWTIVAGSAFWRLVCVPFAIKGLTSSARMQPHQQEITALQKKVQEVSKTGDRLALAKVSAEMREFYKEKGINPLGGIVALMQMPITLGLFFGVQKMCKLPVEQLQDSGFALLPDLTAADPTMILPIALAVSINIQIMLGVRDLNTTQNPGMAHFMSALRPLSLFGVYFMSGFPSGLLVSLLTTGVLTSAQSSILRMPAVRRYLNIPIPPPESRGRLPPLRETLRYVLDFVNETTAQKGKEAAAAKKQLSRRDALARERLSRMNRK